MRGKGTRLTILLSLLLILSPSVPAALAEPIDASAADGDETAVVDGLAEETGDELNPEVPLPEGQETGDEGGAGAGADGDAIVPDGATGELPSDGAPAEETVSTDESAVDAVTDPSEEVVTPLEEQPEEEDPALTAQSTGESKEDATKEKDSAVQTQASKPSISYEAHVQNIGWQPAVTNGATAGTTGRSLRVEGIRISLTGKGRPSGGVEYRMHVQNIGWQKWARNGALGGTSGRSLRVEAFQLRLYGAMAEQYDVWYRVHVQNVGWMAWAKNGEYAGSAGFAYRMEALQIRLVPKGASSSSFPKSDVSYAYLSDGALRGSAHVQNVGWMSDVAAGQTLGTSGRGLRVEALKLWLSDPAVSGGIRYSVHVQNVGWQGWRSNGQVAGTSGKSLRVEAIKIQLTGEIAKQCDVYYRAHVQDIGWMAWTKNGKVAGSAGLSLRVEAIQVRIVPKGSAAPSNEGRNYRGAAVDATVAKPKNMQVKLVPSLGHGYKPPAYQRCIVLHDTTEIKSFDEWTKVWLDRGGLGVHFLIKKDGSIRQYVDMNQICWHAGGPSRDWFDSHYNVVRYCDSGSAMNQCAIGIELEHIIDGSDYPKAQLDALDALIAYIDRYYGFRSTILQHRDYQYSSPDCSNEFQKYLKNLQDHRTTR